MSDYDSRRKQAPEVAASSVRQPTASEHPRWFVWCVAIGFALLYAGALAAANVLPYRRNGEHGWPFVFMERAIRVPGGLSIFYGPWPFFDPPLVSFSSGMLALNVLYAAILVAISLLVPLYWLKVRRTPIQFSLRSLFVLTTVVACLLAWLKYEYHDLNIIEAAYVTALFSEFTLVNYAYPACIALMAAHWMVVCSTRSLWPSRLFGLHWLTWLTLFLVGTPFLHFAILSNRYAGWPWQFYDPEYLDPSRISWLPLTGDTLIWLAVTAATGTVVEGWIRRVERQAPTRAAAILAMVVAAIGSGWLLARADLFWHYWYDYYSCFLGLAWLIFSIEVLSARHWKLFPMRSLLPAIGLGGLFWFVLSPQLLDDRMTTGFSLLAGGIVATVVDGGYRIVVQRDRGPARFIRPACGECVAYLPVWTWGIGVIIGGMAIILRPA